MRLAIIVPYRDRRTELDIFLPHMEEFLSNKQIDYKIFVAEQSDDRPFNYGKLCNAVVNEIKDDFDYFCFHDVDLLPMNDTSEYYPCEVPTRIFSYDDYGNNVTPYEEYFGGVTIFPKDIFIDVNGFSNDYWGKGYIDMDLLRRVSLKGVALQKTYNYSSKELFECDLKYRKIKYIGTKLTLSKNSFILSDNTSFFTKDYTISLFYKEPYQQSGKKTIFKSYGGHDIQLFVIENQFIFQFFDKNDKLYQIDVKDIDISNNNFISVSHDQKNRMFNVYLNGVKYSATHYREELQYNNRKACIGDDQNHDTVTITNFKTYNRLLSDSEIKNEYYYGSNNGCLDFTYTCLFSDNYLFLDKMGLLWGTIGDISLDHVTDVKGSKTTFLPNTKKGEYKMLSPKFEELVDTYDPDIIENKLTYLDLLDGRIKTEKYGLNSIKYKLLNRTEFNELTEWMKIVT